MTLFRTARLRLTGLLALALIAAHIPPTRTSAQAPPAQQQPSQNGRIVFQSTQGGDGIVSEIYTMDGDGRHQVRLTYNEFDDQLPVWSPRGDRVAFLSWRNDLGFDIYLMNPDGTGERPLRDAEHGGPFQTNNIEWSPDGKKIMFSVAGKITVVEVLDSVGGYSNAPPQNISASAPGDAYDSGAKWSPDGSKVAFISNGCLGCFPDLFVINADGTGERKQLTTTPDTEARPVWTPAGRIAYTSYRGASENTYVINADGTGDQPLTDVVPDVSGPVWSPDGARVLFRSSGPAAAPRGGLYVMNADGTGLTFLTGEANGGNGLFWSPDGNTVVAHSVNKLSAIDIISVAADGTDRRVTNLTKTSRADDYAWSWQRLPAPQLAP